MLISEFKAILGYRVRSRTVNTKNPVLKNQNKKHAIHSWFMDTSVGSYNMVGVFLIDLENMDSFQRSELGSCRS